MNELPKCVGYSEHRIKQHHSVPHHFGFKNGYRVDRQLMCGIGGEQLAANSIAHLKQIDTTTYDPALTYGMVRTPQCPPFRPQFVIYDKVVLTFFGYFKRNAGELSEATAHRDLCAHNVNIMYFMEDDTITVIEPTVQNCGFPQGRVVRRSKIPKNTHGAWYSWKDFNIGIDIEFNGIQFRISDCDKFTREFMIAHGVELNNSETRPVDLQTRTQTQRPTLQSATGAAMQNQVRANTNRKHKKYQELQGNVLTFDCVLCATEKRTRTPVDCITFRLFYFLDDDTVAVKELKENREGRDHFPMLLRRMRLPKNWRHIPITFPSVCMEIGADEVHQYYAPSDFRIGKHICVYGHEFLLLDCDRFTRNYYADIVKEPQPDGIDFKLSETLRPLSTKTNLPDYIGLGSPEDSLASCFGLVPKPPKKDVINYLANANKYLRYECVMDTAHPEDQIRKFILSFSLATNTISIMEPPIRNSGIAGGKFLTNQRVWKPNCDPNNPDYYETKDLKMGAILVINNHRFKIVNCDMYVLDYMQQHPEIFTSEALEAARTQLIKRESENQSATECRDDLKPDDCAIRTVLDDNTFKDLVQKAYNCTTDDRGDGDRKKKTVNFTVSPICDQLSH